MICYRMGPKSKLDPSCPLPCPLIIDHQANGEQTKSTFLISSYHSLCKQIHLISHILCKHLLFHFVEISKKMDEHLDLGSHMVFWQSGQHHPDTHWYTVHNTERLRSCRNGRISITLTLNRHFVSTAKSKTYGLHLLFQFCHNSHFSNAQLSLPFFKHDVCSNCCISTNESHFSIYKDSSCSHVPTVYPLQLFTQSSCLHTPTVYILQLFTHSNCWQTPAIYKLQLFTGSVNRVQSFTDSNRLQTPTVYRLQLFSDCLQTHLGTPLVHRFELFTHSNCLHTPTAYRLQPFTHSNCLHALFTHSNCLQMPTVFRPFTNSFTHTPTVHRDSSCFHTPTANTPDIYIHTLIGLERPADAHLCLLWVLTCLWKCIFLHADGH